jgi:hypothetical protein
MRLLFLVFGLLPLFGSLTVPNAPILVFGTLIIVQSIVMVFFALFFFIQLSLKLTINESQITFTSYWYQLVTSWENIKGLEYWSFFSIKLPVILLSKAANITKTRSREGIYKINPTKIPVGLFLSNTECEALMQLICDYKAT